MSITGTATSPSGFLVCNALWTGSLAVSGSEITLSEDIENYRALIITGTNNKYINYPYGHFLPVGHSSERSFAVGNESAGYGLHRMLLPPSTTITFRFVSENRLYADSGYSETARITGVFGLR